MKPRLDRKTIVILFMIVIVPSLILAAFIYNKNSVTNSGRTEAITIAIPPLEQNTLLYVATKQGYFANNGLKVTIKNL